MMRVYKSLKYMILNQLLFISFWRYLEKRFQSRVIRIFAATCFVLLTCLYLAIVVYAPSLALSQVTGLNINLSIVLTFSVCIFYTSIGGIKAVIWTNVFQVFLSIFLCTKFESTKLENISVLLNECISLGILHVLVLPCCSHCRK